MDFKDFVQLLEGVKSPALLTLIFLAWQSYRSVAKGLDLLQSIDAQLTTVAIHTAGTKDIAGKLEEKMDAVRSDVAAIPLDILRLKAATNAK
jgi:hypothetical protein